MSYEDFTNRLKTEREKHQITQKTMSKIAQMNTSHYCKGENGYNRFSFYELKNMCSSKIDMYHCFTGKDNVCIEKNDILIQNADYRQLYCCLQVIYLCADITRKKDEVGDAWKKVHDTLDYLKYIDAKQAEERNIFKSIRDYNDLTQKQMANTLGMDVKKLRLLEKDKILADSEIVYNMYDKYGISPSVFLKDVKCIRDEIRGLIYSNTDEVRIQLLSLIETILHFFNESVRCMDE